jgi:hypothetical protein
MVESRELWKHIKLSTSNILNRIALTVFHNTAILVEYPLCLSEKSCQNLKEEKKESKLRKQEIQSHESNKGMKGERCIYIH